MAVKDWRVNQSNPVKSIGSSIEMAMNAEGLLLLKLHQYVGLICFQTG